MALKQRTGRRLLTNETFILGLVLLLILSVLGREDVKEGESVTLNCSDIIAINPGFNIHWYIGRAGRPADRIMTQNQNSLHLEIVQGTGYEDRLSGSVWGICVLSNITTLDASEFECVLKIPSEPKRLFQYNVVAEEPPVPTIRILNGSYIQAGDTVVLGCEKDSNTQGTSLEVDFNRTDGGIMHGVINQDMMTLTVESAVAEDEGNYSCRVTNIVGASDWSEDIWLRIEAETTTEETTTVTLEDPDTSVTQSSTMQVPTSTSALGTEVSSTSSSFSMGTQLANTQSTQVVPGSTNTGETPTTEILKGTPTAGGFSQEAIIGITVGSVAGGVIIITVISVLLCKNVRRKNTWLTGSSGDSTNMDVIKDKGSTDTTQMNGDA